MAKKKMSKAKALKILHDGSVRGHMLTEKQRGLFGILASGKKLTRKKKKY